MPQGYKVRNKTVWCECPHCGVNLKVCAYNADACYCPKCNKPFGLSEAKNITVFKK